MIIVRKKNIILCCFLAVLLALIGCEGGQQNSDKETGPVDTPVDPVPDENNPGGGDNGGNGSENGGDKGFNNSPSLSASMLGNHITRVNAPSHIEVDKNKRVGFYSLSYHRDGTDQEVSHDGIDMALPPNLIFHQGDEYMEGVELLIDMQIRLTTLEEVDRILLDARNSQNEGLLIRRNTSGFMVIELHKDGSQTDWVSTQKYNNNLPFRATLEIDGKQKMARLKLATQQDDTVLLQETGEWLVYGSVYASNGVASVSVTQKVKDKDSVIDWIVVHGLIDKDQIKLLAEEKSTETMFTTEQKLRPGYKGYIGSFIAKDTKRSLVAAASQREDWSFYSHSNSVAMSLSKDAKITAGDMHDALVLSYENNNESWFLETKKFKQHKALHIAAKDSQEMLDSEYHYRAEGFYKDIFVDGGISVSANTGLNFPALKDKELGLSQEYFTSSTSKSAPCRHHFYQDMIFGGRKAASLSECKAYLSSNDRQEKLNAQSSRLLYPDGNPRFKQIYVNGGKAESHGFSLGQSGRNTIRTFFTNGGSYSGSCAGAFLGSDTIYNRDKKGYLEIWPGNTVYSNYPSQRVKHNILPTLETYLTSTSAMSEGMSAHIFHNGGPTARDCEAPECTVLATFDPEGLKKRKRAGDGRPSAWTYKSLSQTGRYVGIAVHPERSTRGDNISVFAGSLRIAADGIGEPDIKHLLSNGDQITMDRNCVQESLQSEQWLQEKNTDLETVDCKTNAMIGDRQYHHYQFILSDPSDIEIDVSTAGFDCDRCDNATLLMFLRSDSFAFEHLASKRNMSLGSNKKWRVSLPAGTWNLSLKQVVIADTVPKIISGAGKIRYKEYIGENKSLYLGVPYQLTYKIL